MRITASLIVTSALLAGSASLAAPAEGGGHHQLTFLGETMDSVGQEAAEFLRSSQKLVEQISTSSEGGNVVEKGAKWIKEHINDPRCRFRLLEIVMLERLSVYSFRIASNISVTTISHAEFPEYRLRVKTSEHSFCDPGVKQIRCLSVADHS